MFGINKEKEVEGKEKSPAETTAEIIKEHKENKEEDLQAAPITWKEIKALNKSRYDQIRTKFKKTFIIANKRTGQIVEISAASSIHACKIIGWKSRKVRVLEVKENKDYISQESDKKVKNEEEQV